MPIQKTSDETALKSVPVHVEDKYEEPKRVERAPVIPQRQQSLLLPSQPIPVQVRNLIIY